MEIFDIVPIYTTTDHMLYKVVCSKNFNGNSFEYLKREIQRRFLHLYSSSGSDRFHVLRPLPCTPPYMQKLFLHRFSSYRSAFDGYFNHSSHRFNFNREEYSKHFRY